MPLKTHPLVAQIFTTLDIISAVTDFLPLWDIISILQTCRGARRLAGHIYIQILNRLLWEYINVPSDFRDAMREHGCVVSGSAVLWLMEGFPNLWKPGELDVYTPRGKAANIVDYFIQQGYRRIVPAKVQSPVSGVSRLWQSYLLSVTKLENLDLGTKVDVLESVTPCAIKPITCLFGSLLMNYISADSIMSFYPRMTIRRIGVVRKHNGLIRITTLTKYWHRGFDISIQMTPRSREWISYVCPMRLRKVGDRYCLVLKIGKAASKFPLNHPYATVWRFSNIRKKTDRCVTCENSPPGMRMLHYYPVESLSWPDCCHRGQ